MTPASSSLRIAALSGVWLEPGVHLALDEVRLRAVATERVERGGVARLHVPCSPPRVSATTVAGELRALLRLGLYPLERGADRVGHLRHRAPREHAGHDEQDARARRSRARAASRIVPRLPRVIVANVAVGPSFADSRHAQLAMVDARHHDALADRITGREERDGARDAVKRRSVDASRAR